MIVGKRWRNGKSIERSKGREGRKRGGRRRRGKEKEVEKTRKGKREKR